jgi:hypothetical protein
MNQRLKSQPKTVSLLASARAARSTIAQGIEPPQIGPTLVARRHKAPKQPIRNRRTLHWGNGWSILWNNRWIKREAT